MGKLLLETSDDLSRFWHRRAFTADKQGWLAILHKLMKKDLSEQ